MLSLRLKKELIGTLAQGRTRSWVKEILTKETDWDTGEIDGLLEVAVPPKVQKMDVREAFCWIDPPNVQNIEKMTGRVSVDLFYQRIYADAETIDRIKGAITDSPVEFVAE